MQLFNVLREITSLPGVSGREFPAAARLGEYLTPLCGEAFTTRTGSVVGLRRSAKKNAPTVIWDAHIDSVGFYITGVDKSGFLRFRTVGLDQRVLPDRDVWLDVGGKRYLGVVMCLPPHTQSAEDAKKSPKPKDLGIDVGMDYETAKKTFPLGTTARYAGELVRLAGDYVSGPSLDDRAGFATLLLAAELLGSAELPYNLAIVGSAGEETHGLGAATVPELVNADRAIVVDVTHGRTPDSPKDEAFKLGCGPVIGLGSNMNRAMSTSMRDYARAHGIPHEIEVLASRSGTNAEEYQLANLGVACALVSLPQRYMHTPVEVLRLRDIELAARLIAGFSLDIPAEV